MKKIRIGILREGKVPPDRRVPFTPQQCTLVQEQYPNVEILVQPSLVRAFVDLEYSKLGIKIQENLSECDILMGVKEVNISDLIPDKKFLFFSHTIKKQTYNRHLLQSILNKKIELIDYEALKDHDRKRIVGFGRFAGIVGAYNGMMAFGLKMKSFELKRARDCFDRIELENQLKSIVLPSNFRLVLTGFGKVGYGAREIVELLDIKEVSPDEYLNEKFNEPIFTQLETGDYFSRKTDGKYDKSEFYSRPEEYLSSLNNFVKSADVYMASHFWSKNSPVLLTQTDLQNSKNLKVIADISCDIAGPIAATLRASSIEHPIFGYNTKTGLEDDLQNVDCISVMSVDNLPCELPKEASEDFGKQLISNVLPHLLGLDSEGIIQAGKETTSDGKLTDHFSFLQDYVDGINE
jgi:alanine dehydrogenase